ncbi:hypothetical protein ASPACDRAFT_40593 [Aspergillus aculeatus ATCC 16872]|uniref:Extracellular membrane protein CFEM domain-containing protein n=1 Tax=Aspergillus aculeatus (strain ATCC 16872 / CBS 172.66 / WB 5094) TaxID=690307 RepID=A0A1L9X479_ASPA1|nr:uncharacterized protein ASPACDRAFT_40593 [Aspergillus aculeatus ATCC 16872]OJK03270.1 hypothetical protein ASPACDRAFT_40593 [Aspergillus aculeatus ATCC 16872]
MAFSTGAWLAIAATLSQVVVSKQAGYFDSSDCVAPSALESCYDDASEYYAQCITNNCAGGSDECYKACGGDAACMQSQCPDLGIDCINVCGCVKTSREIDCAASACWNQVYSCEYQKTIEDLIDLCPSVNITQLPFWPPPDDAPAGCSCNIGKVDQRELLIADHMTTCANNMTNLDQLTSAESIADYARACTCCGKSAIISTIWGVCPNTQPALLGADTWYNAVIAHDWDICGSYLENYDCAGALGYGASSAGNTTQFYKPGDLPANGTETLSNTGGVISTPISGSTFTWTLGTVPHPITAMAATATVTADSGKSSSTTTGAAAAAATTKSESAARYTSAPIVAASGFIAFTLALLKVA